MAHCQSSYFHLSLKEGCFKAGGWTCAPQGCFESHRVGRALGDPLVKHLHSPAEGNPWSMRPAGGSRCPGQVPLVGRPLPPTLRDSPSSPASGTVPASSLASASWSPLLVPPLHAHLLMSVSPGPVFVLFLPALTPSVHVQVRALNTSYVLIAPRCAPKSPVLLKSTQDTSISLPPRHLHPRVWETSQT